MTPDLSRRNVRRLSRQMGLPEGTIREMLTIGAGVNPGDVVESPEPGSLRRLRFWLPVALIPAALTSIYLLASRLLS